MRILMIVLLWTCAEYASAVSLNGKTNDDRVCDLAPYTTHWLGQRTFVPARTPKLDEIYSRLAMRFIVEACRQGQTLIMHSDDGSSLDDRYFTQVGAALCGAAALARESAATAEGPHAFRVKCRISRMDQARMALRQAEAQESTERMLAAVPAMATPASPEADAASRERERRCEHGVTLGALIGVSGGCRK